LANRDGLKAAEVKELVGTIQQQSLKLFEAAYKKMAAQNQQGKSEEPKPEEPKSEEGKSGEAK
jgi:molecular chaperone DnaK